MRLDYVPLLCVQRGLYDIPRDERVNGVPRRFREYLRAITDPDGAGLEPPLVGVNPMVRDHVTAALDALLALDADGVAARAVAEAAVALEDVPGESRATLLVYDDWMGWANRAPYEFDLRFQSGPPPERLPRWAKHFWVSGVLWGSEPATARAAREAMLTAAHRVAYVHWHGPARTLRDKLAQEGHVMAAAGCAGPALDPEDVAHTREVLAPYLDADDSRTAMECLFGDDASRALGFTPRGLSPWAGLALALHDTRPDRAPGRAGPAWRGPEIRGHLGRRCG
jgi:hypothetical protein